MQQRTVEKVVDVPQSLAETVEVERFAPRERVQQRTVEKVVDVPQSLAETVEVERFAPRERVQQRTVRKLWMCLSLWQRLSRW